MAIMLALQASHRGSTPRGSTMYCILLVQRETIDIFIKLVSPVRIWVQYILIGSIVQRLEQVAVNH